MAYFPMFMELEKKVCVIIGGGKVALRKANVLVDYGAKVIIIAPNFQEQLKQMEQKGMIILKEKIISSMKEIDKKGLWDGEEEIALCVCATDRKEVNEKIALWCQKERIPVNVVDNKSLCTFLFPAVVKKKEVSIGITTSGTSPSASSYLREQIEGIIDDEFLTFVEEMGEYRQWLKQHVEREEERRRMLHSKWEQWKQGE